MAEPRLVLVCGLPGSGKTTRARELAVEIPGVRFCPDEWLDDLGFDYYDTEARDKVEKRLWKLGQELLRLGETVILEYGFWTRTDRDEMRIGARTLGVGVQLQYLDVPADERWRRLDARNALAQAGTPPIARERFDEWVASMEAPDGAELSLFDAPENEEVSKIEV